MSGTVIEEQNKIAISFYRIPVACTCIHSYSKRLSGFKVMLHESPNRPKPATWKFLISLARVMELVNI